jgi:xanthine phosphoribosyltransferase
MEKSKYTYEELSSDMKKLAEKIRPYNFVMIIPITRGGHVPACHLGYLLNIKNFGALCLNSYHGYEQKDIEVINVPNIPPHIAREKILVVDSMVDKGTTLTKVKEMLGDVKFLAIHLKPHSKFQPDFYMHLTDEWVVYPWEYEE